VMVLLKFISMGFEVQQLKQQSNELQSEILATYQQVAPGGRLIPGRTRAQMQQLLDRATGASSDDAAFMPMLEKLSEGMVVIKGVQTTNLNYDSVRQELRIDLLVSSLPVMDQLKENLSAKGLQVEVGAASAQGNQYAGRLIIRSAS
jgi:general secretion pathway protein L